MGQQQQRDNSGILFKNDNKKSDNHPDYKGDALVGGVSFFIAAWIKEGARGKFLSISFTEKDKQPQQQPRQQSSHKPIVNGEFQSDDVPF